MSDEAAEHALIHALVQLLNAAAVHQADNAAVQQCVAEVVKGLDAVGTGAPLNLQAGQGALFLDERRIRLSDDALRDSQALQNTFQTFKAGQLTFKPPVTAEDVTRFVAVVQRWRRTSTPERAQAELTGAIRLGKVTVKEVDGRHRLLQAYARLVAMVDTAATDHQPVITAPMRRVVVELLEASTSRGDELLALTQSQRRRWHVGHRAASVASLTALLCQRLSLPRVLTLDLAMTALVHDFRTDEATEWRRQVVATVLRLVAPGPSPSVLRLLPAIADARRTEFPAGLPFSTAGRLIAVPATYDALVFPPPPMMGLSPDKAIAAIVGADAQRFDRRVVRLFSLVVGTYPVGTVVKLSSGAEGIVIGLASGAPLHRPKVRLLGNARAAQPLLDLAEPKHAGVTVISTAAARAKRVHAPGFVFG